MRVRFEMFPIRAVVAVTIAFGLGGTYVRGDTTTHPASRPASSPDAEMWDAIERLAVEDASAGGRDGFSARIERRSELLQKIRAYRAAYPGAPQADEACRRELATMYELGVLTGGRFDEFQKQVEEWLERPPTTAALHEAAYWQIELRSTRGEYGNVRVRFGEAWCEPARLDAYREYVQKYPRSRHVTKLATVLYDDAARRGQREELQAIVAPLRENWPDSGVVEQLSADIRRREAVGKPFALRTRTTAGEVDTATSRGQTIVLVCWVSTGAADRACVARVEAERAARQNVRVVGINLDPSEEAMNACVRDLRIDWPQARDARGWAGEFVRAWGVRATPFVFVIDARGNLVGSTDGDEWSRWLDEAAR